MQQRNIIRPKFDRWTCSWLARSADSVPNGPSEGTNAGRGSEYSTRKTGEVQELQTGICYALC